MAVDVADARRSSRELRVEAGRAAKLWPAVWPKLARGRDLHRRVAGASCGRAGSPSTSSRRRSPSSTPVPHDARRSLSGAVGVTMRRAAIGFGLVDPDRRRASGSRSRACTVLRAGDRLDDHRPADDAVGRVGAARDRAVPAERERDPVRRHPRRGAVDRQRHHRRHRQRPAAADARRPRARRARLGRRCATSSSRPRCRRSSAASSRAGRSPGAA